VGKKGQNKHAGQWIHTIKPVKGGTVKRLLKIESNEAKKGLRGKKGV